MIGSTIPVFFHITFSLYLWSYDVQMHVWREGWCRANIVSAGITLILAWISSKSITNITKGEKRVTAFPEIWPKKAFVYESQSLIYSCDANLFESALKSPNLDCFWVCFCHQSATRMVGDWYDSSRTLKSAVVLTGVTFIVFLTAFFSPYWLQSFSSERLPNPKFKNLGKIPPIHTTTKFIFGVVL